MPGTLTGPVTGFIERQKGKGLVENSALQRIGKGGMLAACGGNVSVQVGSAGNGADTTEDTLFTATIPANTLDVVGRNIVIQAFGSVTATSATKTPKLYFGTSITQSIPYTTTQTGGWQITMFVFKTGASTQNALIQFDGAGATTTRSVTVITNGSETDTAGIVVKVTGQSSVATANTVICNGLIIEGYN